VTRNFENWLKAEDSGDKDQLRRCWQAAIVYQRKQDLTAVKAGRLEHDVENCKVKYREDACADCAYQQAITNVLAAINQPE